MPARVPWWKRWATAVRSSWAGPLTSNSPELARLWQAPTVSSGISVSETTALNYSAVWAAVALIAGDVASLPLILYKRLPAGGRERYVDHPLYRLLHDAPNEEMASMTFREALTAHLLTWGNAYAEIERDAAGRPIALWPLTPDRVTPVRAATGALTYRIGNPTGADTFLRPADVLHIPGLGYDGTIGYSVVAKARESFGLGLAAERFGGSFFGNGAQFGGVLSHPNVLSDQGRRHLRESIESRHQGVDRAHRFLLLEEGLSYTALGVPPDDAQFLETRQFQVSEVARWFSVPPHKIGDLTHATFSNIEHQGIDYLTTSLRRWLVRWEQEINRKLIAPSERRLQYVEHLTDALLRGDIQSRYAAYAIGRQWGWLSVDEVRERENLNPLPDGQGQRYLVPLNMTPADRLDEVIDKQVEETPAPVVSPPAGDPEPDDAESDAQEEAAAERARVFQRLEAELDQAQTDAHTARAALETAQTERDQARAEAHLAEAERRATDARERELRERVAAADAQVVNLMTKLELLEQLRAAVTQAPVLQPTDIVAPVGARLDAVQSELRGAITHALDEVRADRTAADTAAQQAAAVRDASVVAAHRALLVDAMTRLLRIETDRCRRQAPEKLARWIETFYPTHGDVAIGVLLPAVRAHLAWRGAAADPEAVTQRLVARHVETSVRELRMALQQDPETVTGEIQRTLARWEQTRAAATADALLREAGDV